MSAQAEKFLPAKRLGITAKEYDGLIAVMKYLRRPQVVHANAEGSPWWHAVLGGKLHVGFNMGTPVASHAVLDQYDCGCVACIGGHLSMHMQGLPILRGVKIKLTKEQEDCVDKYVTKGRSRSLEKVFYPGDAIDYENWGQIKPTTAASAIESFLTTGITDWVAAALKNDQSDIVSEAV